MKPTFQKILKFRDIWPRNHQKIAQIEVFGHFLDIASLVFLDFAHNDRWAWCLVVFLQFAGPVNVFLFCCKVWKRLSFLLLFKRISYRDRLYETTGSLLGQLGFPKTSQDWKCDDFFSFYDKKMYRSINKLKANKKSVLSFLWIPEASFIIAAFQTFYIPMFSCSTGLVPNHYMRFLNFQNVSSSLMAELRFT